MRCAEATVKKHSGLKTRINMSKRSQGIKSNARIVHEKMSKKSPKKSVINTYHSKLVWY